MTHKTIENKDFHVKLDRIIINKHENWVRYFWVFSFLAWIIYGILNILRYFKTENKLALWSGIIAISTWLTVGIVSITKKYNNKILYKDIEIIKIRMPIDSHYLVEICKKDGAKKQVIFDAKAIKVLIADLENNGLTVEKEEE